MPTLREGIAALLRDGDYEAVLDKAREDRRTVRTLMGILYHDDELVRWRAVTMFGHLAAAEPGLVSPFIFRLLWSLNEESSVVGWCSAQALGEIARRNPALTKDSVRVVVHFLDDDEVCRPANRNTPILIGAIWAIGNLALQEPALTTEMGPALVTYLDDPDPDVRAHTAWALGRLAGGPGDKSAGMSGGASGLSRPTWLAGALDGLRALADDSSVVRMYIDGQLVEREISDVAAEAVAGLAE